MVMRACRRRHRCPERGCWWDRKANTNRESHFAESSTSVNHVRACQRRITNRDVVLVADDFAVFDGDIRRHGASRRMPAGISIAIQAGVGVRIETEQET